jgi:hypothetical protein
VLVVGAILALMINVPKEKMVNTKEVHIEA